MADNAVKALIGDILNEIIEEARDGGGKKTSVGLMAYGSELGQEELCKGARLAQQNDPSVKVFCIGPKLEGYEDLNWIETAADEHEIAHAMEQALNDGVIAGAVALHYPFPVGVTTIGKVFTPGKGKPCFIASSTGTSSPVRTEAMLRYYQEKYEGRYEIVAAFSNTGCARTSLSSGPLTYGSLYQALPFDNDNVLVELSGQSLSYLLGDGYLATASEVSQWEVDLDKKDYHAIVLSYVSEKAEYARMMAEIERDSQNRQRDIFADAIRNGDY